MKKILFVLLSLVSLSSFAQVGLSIDQKVDMLIDRAILNQKLRQIGYWTSLDGIYTYNISGGGSQADTLSIRGNDAAQTTNKGMVMINPLGGRTVIGSPAYTKTYNTNILDIGVGAGVPEAPIINFINGINTTGTSYFIWSETETNNPGTALFSIQVKGSTATPAKQTLLYSPGGDINISPGTSNAFAIQQNTTTRHRMTTSGVFQFLFGIALPSTASKTSAYTVAASDVTVLCDASGGTFNITLPNASTVDVGRVIIIKKTETSANAVGILTGASTQTIDGTDNSVTPNTTLLPASARGCVWLQQTSTTAWTVIGKY